MLRKLLVFSAMRTNVKILLVKVFITFILVEITLRFLSFSIVSKWLKNSMSTSHFTIPSKKQLFLLKYAIRIIAKNLPFIRCYNQALTAKILLKKQGYKSTLFIGFKKGSQNNLEGHAWLTCQDIIVTGGNIHLDYKVTNVFD